MVVVRTDEGTKLTVAGQGDHVAFEAAPVGARLEEPLPACSPLLTAGLTGSEPGRLSTACWRTRPAHGYSPACTLSRWKRLDQRTDPRPSRAARRPAPHL